MSKIGFATDLYSVGCGFESHIQLIMGGSSVGRAAV